MEKPSVTSTNHLLPFGELAPAQFERLCLWLVERLGYTSAQHLGAGGNEQGRDITAYRGAELWYFQCKRYRELSSARLIAEVVKYNELAARDARKKPHGVVFVTNAVLTAKTREDVETFCRTHGYECEFWAQTELDERVKRHPDIVAEFFNLPRATVHPLSRTEINGERNVYIQGDAPNVTIITGDHNAIHPQLQTSITKPAQIKLSLPPPLTPYLFGRDEELQTLDAAWANPSTNIVVFHALGGAGKSALVSKWLAQMAKKNYDGARRVFGWSFFSQGSSENRSDSSEAFIDNALAFFGVTVEGDYFRKADRLAEALRAERTVLVLDGVEPLQYPPNTAGLPEGGLKDRALQTILLQLAAQQPGLCIITSRERLSDLNGYDEATVIQRPLDHLPYTTATGEQPCAQLLRALGVTGDDAEMLAAAREFKGHAYGLTLLGSYVAEVLGGDLRRRKDIANLFDDDRFGASAERMIAAYETWLGAGVEVAILRLLGLFDRPAEAASIAALREAPAIAGLTETICTGQNGERERPAPPATGSLPEERSLTLPVPSLPDVKWQQTLSKLRRLNLLSPANPHTPGDLDAHPLVREYFRQQLRTHLPDAWRAGNLRLYEHLTRTAKEFPDTLIDMQPLFAAVTHGCAAGLCQKAFNDVYRKRIHRWNNLFNLKELGAYSSDLAVLLGFFTQPWQQPIDELGEASKAFVLNQAGFDLHALGRLTEAVYPMQMALDEAISQAEDGWEHAWEHASSGANNLSGLWMTLGELESSLKLAQQSINLAKLSCDEFGVVAAHANLADVLHQTGKLEEALAEFSTAIALQQECQPEFPFLYSLSGFRYCDLLLSQEQFQEVVVRASQMLEDGESMDPLLPVALYKLALGRAHLGLAQQTDDSALNVQHLSQAAEWLQRTVGELQQAGRQDELPRGLLARAELHRVTCKYERARADLAEAFAIAERSEMRLHLTDYHLESARLALAEGDKETARDHYDKARQLIAETGYHRRDGELKEIAEQMG